MKRKGRAEIAVKPRRASVSDGCGPRMNHRAWRELKRKFKAHSKIQRSGCYLEAHGMCLLSGLPIDYTSTGQPDSFEADHIKPRETHPALALTWSNLGATHLRCNRSKQSKVLVPQDNWVRPKF